MIRFRFLILVSFRLLPKGLDCSKAWKETLKVFKNLASSDAAILSEEEQSRGIFGKVSKSAARESCQDLSSVPIPLHIYTFTWSVIFSFQRERKGDTGFRESQYKTVPIEGDT